MAKTGEEIANVYVAMTVRAPGIKRDIEKEIGSVDASGAGTKIADKLAAGMKKTLKVTGVGIAAVLGTALVKGFGRLKAIETAQAKMRGLGYDSETVSKAMDNALASVKGTAFGLGDAATAAGQLMAANIKPGEQLEGVLSTVANNASAAGTSFDEMGSIFARAASQANGVQNDVISQLADRGIPIYQALADQLGVTAGEVFKMASAGEIGFDVFQKAATAAAGTVADEMGNTTTGAFDNMMAALGRLGAKLLEDIYPLIGPLFKDITAWLDEATTHVEPFIQAVGTTLKSAFDKIVSAMQWVQQNKDWLGALGVAAGLITGVTVAVRTFRAVQLGLTAATYGVQGAMLVTGGSAKVYNTIMALTAAKTKIVTVAQKAFNAVLRANPIGIIVTAIAALVAGLVWFFTQTETGKKIWGEFTRFLGEAWANISSFFQSVWENVLKPVFEGIGQVLSFVWNSILKPIFDGIAAVVTWVWENVLAPIFNIIGVQFAILGGLLQGVWEFVLKPIFDAIGAIFTWLYENIVQPIIAGIQLYVRAWAAIFTWLWNNILKPVFDAIGKIFNWVWSSVIKPVVDWIREKIELFGLGVQILWSTYVKPAFDKIGEIFNWIWNNIISPVVSWIQEKITLLGLGFRIMYEQYIKPAWDSVSAVIKRVWEKGIKPVIDTLTKVIKSDPKEAFEAARDAIGDAWAGIQELAKKPVRFVVDTVINGLIDTINMIPGVDLPKVKLPKGFARGGILPGMSRMSDGDDQLIMARRGEGMMVSEALRTSADRAAFLAANAAGRRGVGFASMLQGLARGGLVNPLPRGSYSVSQPYHGGHNGIDLAAPSGTKVYAAASGTVGLAGAVPMGGNEVYIQHSNGLGTRYSHLSRFATQAGSLVKAGNVIGYVGSTGMSTGPHLHYMVHSPGGGAGVYGNHVNPAPYMGIFGKDLGEGGGLLSGLVDWVAGQVKEAFPAGGMWIDVAAGIAKDAAKRAIDVFTPKLGTDTGATLYDNGGWLPPGFSLVENRTGRPEPILTGSQWDDIGRLADNGRGISGPVRLVVGRREFEAYLEEVADGRIEEATAGVSDGALSDALGVRR